MSDQNDSDTPSAAASSPAMAVHLNVADELAEAQAALIREASRQDDGLVELMLPEMLAGMHLPLIVVSPDLHLRGASVAFRRLAAIPQSAVGKPLDGLGDEGVLAGLVSDCRTALEEEQPRQRECESDSGARFLRNVEPYLNEGSNLTGLVVTLTNIDELLRTAQRLRRREEQLHRQQMVADMAAHIAHMGVWEYDPTTDEIEWNDELHHIVTGGDRLAHPTGAKFFEMVVPEHAAHVQAALTDTVENSATFDEEFQLRRSDGKLIWLQGRAERMVLNGKPKVVGMNMDITARKAETEQMTVMMHELDHRIKNLLAIIISISRLTAGSASDVESFVQSFTDRLQAMSRAHDLLAKARWQDTYLRDLLLSELTQYRDAGEIEISGPRVSISAPIAQSLSMMFHELGVNAVRHGALRTRAGRLQISWDIEPGERPQNPTLVLTWQEFSELPVLEPDQKGYGSDLLDRIVRLQLAAESSVEYPRDGLRMTLRMPMTKLQA